MQRKTSFHATIEVNNFPFSKTISIFPPLLPRHYLVSWTTASPYFPYYLSAISQLEISVRVCCKTCTLRLLGHYRPPPRLTVPRFENAPFIMSERSNSPTNTNEDIPSEYAQIPISLYQILRHPCSRLVILTMMAFSALLVFLPRLSRSYFMQTRDGMPLKARYVRLIQTTTLFSTGGVPTFVTEVVITFWPAEGFGSRSTLAVLMGLAIMKLAFSFLFHPQR